MPRTGIFSKFAFATAKDFANFTALNFDFKLDTAITSLYFTINIYNGTQSVGSKTIFSNQNGFLNSITSVQNINIPKEEFYITGTNYTHIEIRPRSYSSVVANLNYRIDNVKLIDGFTTNPNNPVQTTHTHSNLSVLEQITQEMIDAIGASPIVDPSQITITTTTSITTDTLGDEGKTQKEKNVIISNGVNAINITVNGGTNFLASYIKHGTGAITFVQGSGRTLIQVDGTAVLNGAVGSTATISSIGIIDYLRISNV